MKIFLRVIGDTLFKRLVAELAALNSAFPRRIGTDKMICWQIDPISPPFRSAYLENTVARVSVVLIEVRHTKIVDELWAFAGRDHPVLCSSKAQDCPPAPVILVFDREYPMSELAELPALVTDWISGETGMHDLARRVIASLRRQKHLLEHLGGGMLTLNSESRRLRFNDVDFIQLSVAEVPLAELLLTHVGSVVPMAEIQLLFRLAGRSTSGSNIRVTIFQLRFKIELLTKNHFSICCAYGEGYVLRSARGKDPGLPWAPLEARQAAPTLEGWS